MSNLFDIPGSELHFWSKKVKVPSSEVEVSCIVSNAPRTEVKVASKKVEVSCSECERWGLESDR